MPTRRIARPATRLSPAVAIVVALLLTGLAAPGAPARAATPKPLTSRLPGLPAGAAQAALRPEAALPVPTAWPFSDEFSRTSGTGRLMDGAFEWTDWVYDAFGAAGSTPRPGLAEARGSYTYPSGPADDDGADIFRAAVGLTKTATIWRVDWNTLADPVVPMAEWAFDTDDNASTGASAWPADAEVTSPGIDAALVVSAKGTRLINAVTGRTIATFATAVDMNTRSFLVRVPLSVLPVSGTWRIRLGAGLANPNGTAFAVPTTSGGQASSTAARLYNITFRTAAQEPTTYSAPGQADAELDQLTPTLKSAPVTGPYGVGTAAQTIATGNSWADADQADTLATGNVSKFSQTVEWSQLADRVVSQPPLVYGWSQRWYTTAFPYGQGEATGAMTQPQTLGRIQPYAIYVPTGWNGHSPIPLTWDLHAAGENYLSPADAQPRFTRELCQDRKTICASPEGFGPVGFYTGTAENDFWQVWRQLALAFDLDPTRTVITGYSMGGFGTYLLSASYPSDFSEAMPLDGAYDVGCSTLSNEGQSEFIEPAAPDRTPNIHWVPLVASSAYADELSLLPNETILIQRLESSADRFNFFFTTGGEHVATLVEDGFSTQVAALNGTPAATVEPGTINYTWCPQTVDTTLGLGPTAVYWLSGLGERATGSGDDSHVVATDAAIPEPAETEAISTAVVAPADAAPMQKITGTWTPGASPAAARTLTLTLTNLSTVTVDTASARLPAGTATIITDGPTRLTLANLQPGTLVKGPAGSLRAGRDGSAVVALPQGTARLTWAL